VNTGFTDHRAMAIQRLDHVGIVVDDLAATQSFFRDIGLQVGSEFRLEGEWLDNVVGLPDVHTESVTMQTPDGAREARAHEVHTPADHEGCSAVRANRLGIRHIAFAVDDLDDVLERLQRRASTPWAQFRISRTFSGSVLSAARGNHRRAV